VSPSPRLTEFVVKTTVAPSALIAGQRDWPLPIAPPRPFARLTGTVVPASIVRTWMSYRLFESAGKRFDAVVSKAMWDPSASIAGADDGPLPAAVPKPFTLLTSAVAPVPRSRR
jgi:hypothetical protein